MSAIFRWFARSGVWVSFALVGALLPEALHAQATSIRLPCNVSASGGASGDDPALAPGGIKPCNGPNGLAADAAKMLEQAVKDRAKAYYEGRDSALDSTGGTVAKTFATPVCNPFKTQLNEDIQERDTNHKDEPCGEFLRIDSRKRQGTFDRTRRYYFKQVAPANSERGGKESAHIRGLLVFFMSCGLKEMVRSVEQGVIPASELPSSIVERVDRNNQGFLAHASGESGTARCQPGEQGRTAAARSCYNAGAQQSAMAAVMELAMAQLMTVAGNRLRTLRNTMFDGDKSNMKQDFFEKQVVLREIRANGRGRAQSSYQTALYRILKEQIMALNLPAYCTETLQ
jgi:hypothetical protein